MTGYIALWFVIVLDDALGKFRREWVEKVTRYTLSHAAGRAMDGARWYANDTVKSYEQRNRSQILFTRKLTPEQEQGFRSSLRKTISELEALKNDPSISQNRIDTLVVDRVVKEIKWLINSFVKAPTGREQTLVVEMAEKLLGAGRSSWWLFLKNPGD